MPNKPGSMGWTVHPRATAVGLRACFGTVRDVLPAKNQSLYRKKTSVVTIRGEESIPVKQR